MDVLGILSELTALTLVGVLSVTLLAGFVKGAVGFAMPMIMISGLASFLPVEQALAALIVPTLLTNTIQALRHGVKAALTSIKRFRVYLGVMLVFLAMSAQLVLILSPNILFLIIGLSIVIFALLQLLGWSPRLAGKRRNGIEALIAAFAGFVGGVSGVWGPPLVAYLTAIKTPKPDQMRIQGVVYGIGAVALTLAHLKSGVLNAQSLPLSIAMTMPALLGMALGLVVHDRLPQNRFRRATLIVLVVAGLNLVRRGVFG